MFYKLSSRLDTELLIEEIQQLLIPNGVNIEKVFSDLREYVGILEDNYGKNGRGGYIYFFCAPNNICSIKNKILKEYSVSEDEAEFKDVIEEIKPNGWKYIFELFIISTDYHVVLIYPEGGE